jgi:regulator of protease activity HflC (stomatin/prohibitin superfamily)
MLIEMISCATEDGMFIELIVKAITVISVVGWIVFTLYTLITFLRLLIRRGPRNALRFLISLPVLATALVLLLFSALSFAMVYVAPEKIAVVPSVFSPRGIRPQALQPGFHIIIPFLESSIEYPAYWQTYTMSANAQEGETVDDASIRARTSDGQEVTIDCSIIFRIDTEQAVLVHVDWQNRYRTDFVRAIVRGEVRTQISQFTAEEVNSSARVKIETLINQKITAQFSKKGFILDQIVLRDITFSEVFASAIERKQVALEDQIRSQYEAEKLRLMAAGQGDAILIEARARARALEVVGTALETNPQLLSYTYIERLAPTIQTMLLPAGNQFILPLPSLAPTNPLTATNPLTTPMPILPTTTDTISSTATQPTPP